MYLSSVLGLYVGWWHITFFCYTCHLIVDLWKCWKKNKEWMCLVDEYDARPQLDCGSPQVDRQMDFSTTTMIHIISFACWSFFILYTKDFDEILLRTPYSWCKWGTCSSHGTTTPLPRFHVNVTIMTLQTCHVGALPWGRSLIYIGHA